MFYTLISLEEKPYVVKFNFYCHNNDVSTHYTSILFFNYSFPNC